MTNNDFAAWLEGHGLTVTDFSKLVGHPNANQVSQWRGKVRIPAWLPKFCGLYDENKRLLAQVAEVEAEVPSPDPKAQELTPEKLDALLADAVNLPELAGSAVSRAEALPMRRKLIEGETSPGWWVKVFKEWLK